MSSSHQPGSGDESRPQRIERLVLDCLARQVTGDTVSIAELSSSHPDLMPELGEAVRRAILIGNARRRARAGALPESFALAGYEIVREIRRGGQGVVYEAVQRSTGRTVAIKLLRDGSFAGAGDRVRFEREVRILAQLNHPNIVTIHDSGVTPAGDSYYVMNYIEGMTLDDHVQRHGGPVVAAPESPALEQTRNQAPATPAQSPPPVDPAGATGVKSVRDGLRLFRTVCDAVHAAHLRGIIHRDLKPSNIRVDSRGEPHVLDFGLAKLSDARLDTHTAAEFTQSGQFVGSLPWASPEQVEGRTELIDIRTDVYSLGVILYQMLTGRFPYPVLGPIREVMDHITRTAPARPRVLRPALDDEVETIVLKCLAKEPERRYQGAGELARDIERYLAGDAIEAKRDSIHYILRKQLRRYRLPLGIAAAFVLLIIVGLGTSLVLWRQAAAEGRRAEAARRAEARQRSIADENAGRARQEAAEKSAINRFLQAVLGAADPREARDRNITVRTALDEAAKKLDAPETAQSPRIEAAIRTTLGQTYRSLGAYAVAESQLRRATALYEQADPGCLDAANAWNLLGLVLIDLDRPDEAVGHLQRAVAIAKSLPEEHGVELAVFLNSLGNAHFELRQHDEAEASYRQALVLQRARLGNVHEDVAETLDNLGMLLTWQEEFDEAEPLLREALAIQRQVLDARHPHLATTLSNLADVLAGRHDNAEAESLWRESLQIREAVLGEAHPHVAVVLVRLARVLMDRHEDADAEALLRRALAIRRRTPDEGWQPLAANLTDLAALVARRGRTDEAESLYREALDIRRARLGKEHADTAECMNNLAGVLMDAGRIAEAGQLYRETLNILEKSLPAGDFRLAATRNNLANVLRRQERYAEAEPLHRQVLAALQAQFPDGNGYVARSMCNLAGTLSAQGKHDEAESLCRAAVDLQRRLHAPRDHFDIADALGDLAKTQAGAGRLADAESSLRDALAILERIMPEGHPALVAATCQLADCLARQEKFDLAEELWRRAVQNLEGNPAVTDSQRRVVISGIVDRYEGAGRSRDAARWRKRLPAGD